MEVQRYPTDFDGIIAGDPATGTPMQAGRALVFQKLLASTESYLPIEKIEMLSKATLAACDATDGLKDGLVTDPQQCTFKPESLKCTGADGPNCLTAAPARCRQADLRRRQAAERRAVYAYGFPFGHEGGASGWRAWTTGTVPPTRQADGTLDLRLEPAERIHPVRAELPLPGAGRRRPGLQLAGVPARSRSAADEDHDRHPQPARSGPSAVQEPRRQAADVSRLGRPGDQRLRHDRLLRQGRQGASAGRRISSRSRACISCRACTTARAVPDRTSSTCSPCSRTGSSANVAPAAVVATHKTNGAVDRTRPLCPHPQVARYSGTGSVDEAANFRCEAPGR